ncbi:hypothetical protein M433DRAFT_155314 [Acidomyces richmondensis BFW]|nr:MAG: hypothetical protein FE78DRAFT_93103 [Acidomyces sp. 'richmondensis']KYG44726.1 hypothetical protein M433DRAFT_155314 [Acidomyces richmondensis BFW]
MPADIRNFFRPFTVPKRCISEEQNPIEEVIVVATPSRKLRQLRRRDAIPEIERRKTASPRKKDGKSPSKGVSSPLELSSSSLGNVPLRTTPRKKRLAVASVNGAKDNVDLFHSSPKLSAQRTMRAVELPSQSSSPSQSHPQTNGVVRHDTSYSSISTLSSLPVSSQSFSRRVLRDGLQAVVNSDSGSADDSDDELAELDAFIPHKKRRMTPPGRDRAPTTGVSETNMSSVKRNNARLSERNRVKNSRSTPRASPSSSRTAYKHSLANMIKANEERKKQEAKIAETEAALAAAEKRREEQQAAEARPLDSIALAELVQNEREEGQRIMAAMARTEALEEQEKFLYFKEHVYKARLDPFPMQSLPETSWAKILRDKNARIDACLTGFVAELGAHGKLDAAVISWFARQLVHEPREELCEAYVEIIRASAPYAKDFDSSLWTMETFYHTTFEDANELSPKGSLQFLNSSPRTIRHEDLAVCICGHDKEDSINVVCDSCGTWQHGTCSHHPQAFRESTDSSVHDCISCRHGGVNAAGARRRQIKRQKEMACSSVMPQFEKENIRGLQHVARILACYAPYSGVEAMGRCLTAMSLASIDHIVNRDAALRHSLQSCVDTLCRSLRSEDVDELCEFVRRELLAEGRLSLKTQCQIITFLPASSVHANLLRRKLALYLITKSQSSRSLASGDWFSTILKRLRAAPEYNINEKTDYALLQDLTTVLSIAVDVGFSDFTFFSEQTDKFVGPFGKSMPISAGERTFNGQVDAIVEQIKAIGSRIRDVGAAHLRRVEAKAALERLALMLEYGVRTRSKPRKQVFGNGDWESRKFMEELVMRAEEDREADFANQAESPSKPKPQQAARTSTRVNVPEAGGS